MATEVFMQTLPLKGGHLPAVRAGGMRVTKKQGNEDSGPPEKKRATADKPSSVVNLTKMQAMNILTGALEKVRSNVSKHDIKWAIFKRSAIAAYIFKFHFDSYHKTKAKAFILDGLGHNYPEAAQIAHQKPRPTVEKVISQKRLYIIQQPRRF
ncbi:hypothetical protein AB205_0140480 [Aquarana catesbeiana]|uniref:Uncharacterized protein n=1 Tax=Aquarana catesbeiana TaxID=8400 RepID=A0A2G9R7I6_AQUCT|nr:hypothetical protein AB205_0140480 [Aquarana catesbeiana]